MRVGDIALSIRANRHHARPVEAGAHEKQPVAENRPWDYRVTFAVTHPPNFVAGLGIVGADGSAARANDLFLSFDRDGQGRAERKGFLRLRLAIDLPKHLARVLVQRDDKGVSFSVTTED